MDFIKYKQTWNFNKLQIPLILVVGLPIKNNCSKDVNNYVRLLIKFNEQSATNHEIIDKHVFTNFHDYKYQINMNLGLLNTKNIDNINLLKII